MTHAERMTEIKAREAAATPPPWIKNTWIGEEGGWTAVWPIHCCIENCDCEGRHDEPDCRNDHEAQIDADFIAHSRADIPYMIARVEALEAALREAIMVIPHSLQGLTIEDQNSFIDRLTAALEGEDNG